MADITGTLSRPLLERRAKTLTHLVTLRLVSGYTLLIASLIGLFGSNWDIQWHATIGRDRTFTPPHDMILVGIGLLGILSLTSIIIETVWARQNPELEENSTDFLGILHSSSGSYFVGFGSVCAAVAFPLDTYWHALYGIDVSLWAPFHTMLYMSGILCITGITYIFLSAVHLSQSLHLQKSLRLANIGVIVALGLLLSRLTTFIFPSLELNPGGINMFPLFLCLCVALVCTLAVRVLRWPGVATLTILVLVTAYLLISALVPPMMTWLMQVEHQTYLPDTTALRSIVVPLIGQSPWLLLTGLSVDGVILLGRRAHWSSSRLNWGIAIAAAVSTTIVAGLKLIALGSAPSGGQATSSGDSSALLFLRALVIAIPCGLLGSWLGTMISQTIETLRR